MIHRAPYHAHVYYNAASKATAKEVVAQACDAFHIEAGRFHDHPVGPHPTGSCQLTVPVKQLGPVLDWLALNRQGLTVFIHADTGDVMKDHTEHTMWLGTMPDLNLEVLKRFVGH